MFDSNENAYLSDFEIVKLSGDAATFTGNNVLGTPSYISPELPRGDSDVDGTSDIYALGVLIFRMWAGVLPYTANTPLGIAMKHITEPIPHVIDYKPELPPDCDTLISIAMAKERKDRFKTATELSHALDRILDNEHSGDRGPYHPLSPYPGRPMILRRLLIRHQCPRDYAKASTSDQQPPDPTFQFYWQE